MQKPPSDLLKCDILDFEKAYPNPSYIDRLQAARKVLFNPLLENLLDRGMNYDFTFLPATKRPYNKAGLQLCIFPKYADQRSETGAENIYVDITCDKKGRISMQLRTLNAPPTLSSIWRSMGQSNIAIVLDGLVDEIDHLAKTLEEKLRDERQAFLSKIPSHSYGPCVPEGSPYLRPRPPRNGS